MKSINNLCILGVALLSMQLCSAQWFGKKVKGNGKVITKSITTRDYDGIKVSGSMDVQIVPGKEGDITVQAESNIIEVLKIEVKDDILRIGTQNNISMSTRKGIKITVPVERISSAYVSGSGEIIGDMNLKSRNMDIKVSGSGDIELQVECANLQATVTGSGDINLTGRCEHLDANVTGSGDLNTLGVKSNDVDASVTGSGDILTYINGGNLTARVTGSGDIGYKGNVKNTDKKITGSGDIEKL